MDRDFKLSPAEHDRIFEDIRSDSMVGVRPVDRPRAVVLGGQPGSGKSLALETAKQEFEDFNVLVINGDEYRYRHPQAPEIQQTDEKNFARRTDPDVREWTRKLFEHGIEEKVNILFEGTMRQHEPLSTTLGNLLEHGFHVTAKVVAAHDAVSLTSILLRYETMKEATGFGRWVAPASHAAAYEGMPKTLEHIENNQLAHRVEVLDRQGNLLYENNLRDGGWEHAPGARAAVEAERVRPLTATEKVGLQNDWVSIYHHMHERFTELEEIKLAAEFAQIVAQKTGHPPLTYDKTVPQGLERVNAEPGRTYVGEIVKADDQHLIQRVVENDRTVEVVHDRSKLSGSQSSFAPGESARIKYVNQTGIVMDSPQSDGLSKAKGIDRGI